MLRTKSTEDSSDSSLIENGQFTDDALGDCLAFFVAEDAAKITAAEQGCKQKMLSSPRKENTIKREGDKHHTRCDHGGYMQCKPVHVQESRARENRREATGECRLKDLKHSEDQGNKTSSKGPYVHMRHSGPKVETMKETQLAYRSNESEGRKLQGRNLSDPNSGTYFDRIKTSAPCQIMERIAAIVNTMMPEKLQSKQSPSRGHAKPEGDKNPGRQISGARTARAQASNRSAPHSRNTHPTKKSVPPPGFKPSNSDRGRSTLDERIMAQLGSTKKQERLLACIESFNCRYRRSLNLLFGVLRAVWELNSPSIQERMKFIRGFRTIFLLLSQERPYSNLEKSFTVGLVQQLAGNIQRIFGSYAPKIRKRIDAMAGEKKIGKEARRKLCDALDICCGKAGNP